MAWGGQGGRTGPAHEPGGKGKCRRTRTEAMLTCSVDFAQYQAGSDRLEGGFSKRICYVACAAVQHLT